ncbi:TatD family hydrolase [Polaribacter litorisediminis]|uniref:TatD family hydrolase n=1 Tax=Polaribacter litorisediminis TaxID=1908341 RepID=UPI001CC16FCB|nr:TatD family hydrolase [Polaribacter litorisediminis]UAM98336.1 TatD family hydrolase [Polaribacter litorisediminis]
MLYFDVHTHRFSADKKVFSIVNRYPNSTDFSKPFSIGIHPYYLHKENIEIELLQVAEKLQHKNCFALGECGLDKGIKVDFELQKFVFKKQIQLSEKYQKPLIIHCVKAFQEIIVFKNELKPKQTWILHGFSKNLQVAQSLLKNGIILSIGAASIKNKKLQEVLLQIPIDAMFIETDDAGFEVLEIYQKIAFLKKMKLEELQQKIEHNFKRIFKR